MPARSAIPVFMRCFIFMSLLALSQVAGADNSFSLSGAAPTGSATDNTFPGAGSNYAPPFSNVFVGSLNASFGGTPLAVMCVTIDRTSNLNSAWNARAFSLGGDLTGFGLYDGTAAGFRSLQEAAFLFQQLSLMQNGNPQIIAYQKAAWTLLNGGAAQKYQDYLASPATLPAVNAALALAHSQTFTTAFNNSVYYYSPTDSNNQVFVTVTQIPEASPVAYVAGAFVILGAVHVFRRRAKPGNQIGPRHRVTRLSELTRRNGET